MLLTILGLIVGPPEEENTSTTGTTTTTAPTTTVPPGLPPGDDTTVSRVIDGDTIEVAGGTNVRLIGIDAPETGTCFAPESTAHTAELLPSGMRVRLAYDVGRRDQFGRTLAYIYRLTDGLFVNLALARDGFVVQLTVPPNVAHAEAFRAAVAEAQGANRGLWAACPPTTTTAAPPPPPPPPPPVTRPAPAAPAPAGNCHPSYPGQCIPPPPPDLDCRDVSARRFPVRSPDPHFFDADSDGVGCES